MNRIPCSIATGTEPQSPDLVDLKLSPLGHYVIFGVFKGLDPNPFFDTDWYLRQHPEVAAAHINPLHHYMNVGAALGLDPHPMFDTSWYLEQNEDVAATRTNALVHFLTHGAAEGRRPHPDFKASKGAALTQLINAGNGADASPASSAPAAILTGDQSLPVEKTPDSASAPLPAPRPAVYTTQWSMKYVKRSGYFDAGWYLKKYKDVARSKVDALEHFIRFGSAELRDPGPRFDASWYVEEYPEARASKMPPLEHYLEIGRHKGFDPVGSSYRRWCRLFDSITEDDRAIIARDVASHVLPPLDVLIVVDAASERFLAKTIAGLSHQLYDRWQALIVIGSDCSAATTTAAKNTARTHSKISLIAQADFSSKWIASARGEYVLLMSGGVLIREHALYMFARAAAQSDDAGIVYCDEDTLDNCGNRKDPIFKPKYSPTLARQTNYFGRCVLIRKTEFSRLALDRELAKGSFTFDGAVTAAINTQTGRDTILHVSSVLFHDLAPPDKKVMPIAYDDPDNTLPSISIIIPTRDRLDLLRPCIELIEAKTNYPKQKLEIIVIDNGSANRRTLNFLDTLSTQGRATVIRDENAFNFSRLNNAGAARAKHDVLLFLNNDTIVDDRLWLRRIAHFALQDDVAAIGAKLLYPDRTIQHGGVVLGIQGVAAHDLIGLEERDSNARLDITREISSVTGACLAIRKDVFDKLGGFDTETAIAFNDTLLCLDALKAGYRNIYISDPLVIHHELKSRGYDDRPERIEAFQREARYARRRHNALFLDDPYYSPNLSLQQINELATPPRQSKPWRVCSRDREKIRILFLSVTHEMGYGVPVVIDLQASYLAKAGHRVSIGGPKGQNEMPYNGCERVYLSDAAEASEYAVRHATDCVIVETPPFFSVTRYLGKWPRTVFLDHGEPPADLFLDTAARRSVDLEKRLCATMASKVFAISEAVRADSGENDIIGIIPNGNSHLLPWRDDLRLRRQAIRDRHGWGNKIVVLNVCRFKEGERRYKGLDKSAEIMRQFRAACPQLADKVVFVLCGRGDLADVKKMQKAGFEVFANLSNDELIGHYLAADIYMNFSKWEGYNLGIGQALALGLPVIASDIPAHRAFPIMTSDDTLTIVKSLTAQAEAVIRDHFAGKRTPVVTEWKDSLAKLESEIVALCGDSESSYEPRFARA